jgi:coenzyme F420-dependent glucose-6-phosphate dehydrogenase
MARIGSHASHEQFSPSELLALVKHAEAAGFDCASSSDHFRPWGRRRANQASRGRVGAALETTNLLLVLFRRRVTATRRLP